MKNIDKLLQEERNKRSHELFDKDECELQISELNKLNQYLYDLQHPIWKPIIINGIDTGYQVSNIGEVKGKKGNILRKDLSNTGYYRINGYSNKPIKIVIHRAVANAFIPNPENKPQVNHINGKKTTNWWGNLEWNTPKENAEHAVRTGLTNFKGINHPENVYSENQIRYACQLLENPKNKNIDIVNKTGINRSILYSIRTGKSWSHISSEYNIPLPMISEKKFSNEQIEDACILLANTNLSCEKIQKYTGVPSRTLRKIIYRSPKYSKLNDLYNILPNRSKNIIA